MSRQTFNLNGHTLEIEREMVEVTSLFPQRDPHWKQTDAQGHLHLAVNTDAGVIYPTLEVRWSPPCRCGCDFEDEHVDSWWVCPQCEEKITPGVVYDRSRKFIPGLTSYTLDGEHVPPATAQAFIESWQRQADDRSSRRAQADRNAGYL